MERGSNKHGPRQDDALEHEVEDVLRSGHSSRAEEFRELEGSGEDQPEVDRAPHSTMTGGVPAGMTEADVAGRTELAAALGRVFPADREELLTVAEQNHAPARILEELRRLPDGQKFATVNEVWVGLGHHVEDHRF